jgi:hypothetical protein
MCTNCAPLKKKDLALGVKSFIYWWPETGSNRRHADFQSAALPTELSGLSAFDTCGRIYEFRFAAIGCQISRSKLISTFGNGENERTQFDQRPSFFR